MSPFARFSCGFASVIAATLLFNALSFWRVFHDPGCADCVLEAGVPFPFVSHGGFFTETHVFWRGVRDAVAATLVVGTLMGLMALRVLRRRHEPPVSSGPAC